MTGFKEALYNILLDMNIIEVIANLIVVSLAIVFWILIGIVFSYLVKHFLLRVITLKRKGPRAITIGKLISNIFKYFLWFAVIMAILGEMNVNITPFIASAGVIGLAIGFGAQEIIKDFISGFFIIFEESFNVDDVIEIDGFKGKVLSLGLRTTQIMNWKGEIKVMNNGDIRSLINSSKSSSIAIVNFGVAYETDLLKLQKLMDVFEQNSYSKYDNIIETPVFLGITELDDSSINMRLIAKTKTLLHYQIERDLKRDLVIYLKENKIDIPFPQLVIHNEKN